MRHRNKSYHNIYDSGNQVSVGSDNGVSPIRHQAIIQTSAGKLDT